MELFYLCQFASFPKEAILKRFSLISENLFRPSIVYQKVFPQGLGNHMSCLLWGYICLCILGKVICDKQDINTPNVICFSSYSKEIQMN